MARRSSHPDDVIFTTYVLWLKGHTAVFIGAYVGLRRKQVDGLVARSPFSDRANMDDEMRQSHLDHLRQIHRDEETGELRCGGRLRAIDWDILTLASDQGSKRK